MHMFDADEVAPSLWRKFSRVAVARSARVPRVSEWLVDVLPPFVLFGVIFEALGLLRTYVASRGVNTRWPYLVDKLLFGLGDDSARLSLNEIFARHHCAALDFVTGVAYLVFIYAVLAFAVFLGAIDRSETGRRRLRSLGWTFLGVNVAGYLTYLILPVAPPWYVLSRGFGPVDIHTAASPAALVRWDALVGVPYFKNFYAHATDVFGAMPSMHCAYPMLLLLFSRELRRPRLTAGLVAFQLVMCFSAVYLQHHYMSDVLAGMGYASAGYLIQRRVLAWWTARQLRIAIA
jgi:membrane-associated phospholipid phosphatase